MQSILSGEVEAVKAERDLLQRLLKAEQQKSTDMKKSLDDMRANLDATIVESRK